MGTTRPARPLTVGLAFDLRDPVRAHEGPDDLDEEYDSEPTVKSVAAALEQNGFETVLLGGGRDFVDRLLTSPPDLVFNMAEGHGTRSREAHVPAVCELLGVPFTGSDPLTLAACLDKAVAKSLVRGAGIPTAEWQVLTDADEAVRLSLPAVAKPLAEGSSMGIRTGSLSRTGAHLRSRIAALRHDYGQPVLVEEFLPGPEFTVGILGTDATADVLGVMEIRPRDSSGGDFLYTVDVKRLSDAAVCYDVPPNRPVALVAAVADVALAAYRALGCRDVGRVDIRCDGAGRPQFLECNPLPGLAPAWGDLVIMANALGWSHDALIGRIANLARARLGL